MSVHRVFQRCVKTIILFRCRCGNTAKAPPDAQVYCRKCEEAQGILREMRPVRRAR